MTAKLYASPQRLPDLDVFTVPSEDIEPILDALTPAVRDPSPAKWMGLGDLVCNMRDGTRVEVHLYSTRQKQGAFSVGPYPNQVYYRGGTDSGIEQAIRNAYEHAQKGK